MDKVLEELHCVGIEFAEALKSVVNSLPLVGLFGILLLLTGVLVLEVARDALGQVGVDEVANEGLESSPALLFSSQGDLLLLLERHHVVPSSFMVRLVHQKIHVLHVLQHVVVVTAKYLDFLFLFLFGGVTRLLFLLFILELDNRI